ncbi:protein-tyrosine phosphatase [Dysgonomonas alginatilytica]|uniref:Protein-tyrosine phosphatase n=2 Tax=Dysgonomonas alginatilytica TaxID=1605892 RepID=A0A2V3PL16_9BACT|nr:protein-tyrosine phosphatase [Dysgonomonas alginatilytica]
MISCKDSNMKADKAQYSGKDVSGEAFIIRNKDDKSAIVRIQTADKWLLYSGTSIDNIDFSKPVAEGRGSGIFPLNVPDSVRSYFQFVTPEGKAILAERHLPMEGGYNFRDLGGIKTTDGKFVKWGKIFRSDDLHNLTDGDLRYLSSIPLVSIVDFRSPDEIKRSPDKFPSSVSKDYAYSITPGNLLAAKSLANLKEAQMDSAMMDMNRILVTDSACVNRYKDFFTLLQQEKEVPLMFHCSAGKDRTGMGAALILFALGVDENTIIEDYLSSNIYLDGKYAQYIAQNPNLKPLFEVKKEFIQAGIDEIKKEHGTVENYLTNVLGVDIQKFRERYLY